MTGCPSRQQLFDVVADRASQIESAEIGVHTRSCPDCRDLLAELSKAGALISDRSSVDNGETVMQTLPASSVTPNGAADSGQTFDGTAFGASLSAAAALADAPHASENMDSQHTGADTLDIAPSIAVRRPPSAVSGTAKTIDDSGRSSSSINDTVAFTQAPAARRPVASAAASYDATIDSSASHSNATVDDRTDAGQNGFERTLPDAAPSSASRGKNEPPEYEILGELGRGGMGVVYKARHRRLNRLVALKMIRGAYADDIQIARFKIEAEAVASASPPQYFADLRHRRTQRLALRRTRAARRR